MEWVWPENARIMNPRMHIVMSHGSSLGVCWLEYYGISWNWTLAKIRDCVCSLILWNSWDTRSDLLIICHALTNIYLNAEYGPISRGIFLIFLKIIKNVNRSLALFHNVCVVHLLSWILLYIEYQSDSNDIQKTVLTYIYIYRDSIHMVHIYG